MKKYKNKYKKHDKVLKTNENLALQINNNQQTRRAGGNGFSGLYSINKEIKTRLQKVEDDNNEPKIITGQLSSLSLLNATNQNDQTTTKQPLNTPQSTPRNTQTLSTVSINSL